MTNDDTPPEPDVPMTELFYALSNPRRRRVLRYLRPSVALTVDELARAVARDEEERSDPGSRHRRVRIDLYHCQLPLLAEAGLVRYERISGLVAITDRGRCATGLARLAREADRGTSACRVEDDATSDADRRGRTEETRPGDGCQYLPPVGIGGPPAGP